MIKKLILIFKISYKLAKSGIIEIVEEYHQLPTPIKWFFKILNFNQNNSLKNVNLSAGEKISIALQEMGTTFIKLGQFLATRPDIIGANLADELEKLQDKLPPFSMYEAKEILKKEIGIENFNKIKDITEPVAAASIAQVHFAKVLNAEGDTKEVAIKILRPGIEKKFNEELEALMLLANIAELFLPKTRRLRLIETVYLLREITSVEMDLRFEAAAANELLENTKNDNNFIVPNIYWDFTSQRVLTLDRIIGSSIRDTVFIETNAIDKKKLAADVIQSFLKQAVRDGFFHGDMHQGNLFIDKTGNLIPVDFGIMGRIDENNRRYLAEILYGFIQRDYKKVAEVHLEAGLIPKETSIDEFSQALRSIGEPIFGQKIKDISGGNLLAQLFKVTEKFNMHTQTQLLILQKTMVVVEGVARKIYPETNIWEVSKPILEDWLKNYKSPKTNINRAIRLSKELLEKIPDLPSFLDRANYALKMIAEGKINLNTGNHTQLELEKQKFKMFRNNFIILVLGSIILINLIF